MKKIILLPAFILMVAAQLYFPLRLVLDSETILDTGKPYKFRTASVYPLSPVQGSYILLTYYDNVVQVDSTSEWTQNEAIYVGLRVDSAGFAAIDYVSKEIPQPNTDYVKAFVDYVIEDSLSSSLVIRYPFNRFYLEATPKSADRPVYPYPQTDSTTITYATITVKAGEAIITDVLVNDISIKTQ